MTDDRTACRLKAMDLLARREHSRLELERKLAARSFDEQLTGEVLDALEREGLLSAERFTESFVATRYAKGQGPLRIRRELAERGIESTADWRNDPRFDWDRLAGETRIKRFGAEPPQDIKARARQVRFLEYRGFGHDQIKRALEFDGE
jgi:regulatory protein